MLSSIYFNQYDEDYSNMLPSDLNKEFVNWYYRLGHMSYKKMNMLSVMGIVPKKLKDCDPSACATFIYGGMTKRPSRSKLSQLPRNKPITIVRPGKCVSLQLKGILMK